MSSRESRRFRAAAEGEGDNNINSSTADQQRRRRSTSRSGVFSSGSGNDRTGSSASLRDANAPRRTSSNVSLSHEDEIERIREMRARRLRNERLERDEKQQQEDEAGSNNVGASRERRSTLGSSSSRASSSRSILREREYHHQQHHDGAPSRYRSNPSISRRELEEAGLLRSGTARGGGGGGNAVGGSSSGVIDCNNNNPDNEILSVSSYSKARRERMAAAAAAAVAAGVSSTSVASSTRSIGNDSNSSGGTGRTGREREYRHRGDIDARLAARRMSRERMEASSRTNATTEMTAGGDVQAPESPRRRRDGSPRRSSLSEVSQHSASGKGSPDTSPYKQRRQRPSRSNTGDELQYSINRERLREKANRVPPNRTKSAKGGGMPASSSDVPEDPQKGNEHTTDSLEIRESRKKSLHQSQQLLRAKSTNDVGRDALENEPRSVDRPSPMNERSASTDLTARLRERREARAAEREAREKERSAFRSKSAVDILGPTTDSPSISEAPLSTRKEPQLEHLELNGDAENDNTTDFSIRLCIISAADLPFNVLPNTPLCPVLKLGLVNLPQAAHATSESNEIVTTSVLDKLGHKSIEAVETARVRTTASKVLSKRDNGTVDFHQEYRWDRLNNPSSIGLCVELCARAVRTPTNFRESPPPVPEKASNQQESTTPLEGSRHNDPTSSLSRSSSGTNLPGSSTPTGSRGFWGRTNRKQAELEAAEAAAAVARMLVEQDGSSERAQVQQPNDIKTLSLEGNKRIETPGVDVTLSSSTRDARDSADMTEDVRLGSLVIPLTDLPLDTAINGKQTARLEQWYELYTQEEFSSTAMRRKQPSIRLELSCSSPEIFDDSENEIDDDADANDEILQASAGSSLNSSAGSALHRQMSFMRRAMLEARGRLKEEQKPQEEVKIEDPVLAPGVLDYIAIVGCGNIGDQKKDDGTKGWVETTPDCRLFEQFPPSNDFHTKHGRMALLPEMVQWFCFPEGARLWRGTAPPSHSELNLKRFSASSPPTVTSSVAAFDACLDCTTSFSWFVIASNSDEYGSSLVKTYGAVIRFYVPAPSGVDPTQDDFAQAVMGNSLQSTSSQNLKRLWVPMGICLTSNLPIIGVMEALLLQLCEELSTTSNGGAAPRLECVRKSLANLILNFQKPIAGAVNCAIPFLSGDRRFLLSLPPRTGLPPLPHGRAVISVCRLLGAEGLNFLIAAVLTECKILIHSQDISDIVMVAEVVTALVYPFVWSLPYIPVLPLGMIEFVEAPLSYILGIPSCNLPLVDPNALDDVVVIDLNNGYSPPEVLPGRRQANGSTNSRQPTLLPTSVAANISTAFYKLLRAEAEIEREYGGADFDGQNFPRMEVESLAERDFRVAVAIEVCGLLRGYRECLGHVFNRDKFLKISPAIYEEKRETRLAGAGIGPKTGLQNQSQKVVSARSKRFLSHLVNGQNLQQLLESLESDEACFFHEIMDLIDESSSETKGPILAAPTDPSSTKSERIVAQLMKSLQQVEDKVPTYRVEKGERIEDANGDDSLFDVGKAHDFDFFSADMQPEDRQFSSFSSTVLLPIKADSPLSESGENVQAMSMDYLARIEATPWEYNSLLPFGDGSSNDDLLVPVEEKVKLRDAIGERRFRSWKLSQEKKGGVDSELAFLSGTSSTNRQGTALDLTSLVSSAKSDTTDMSSLSSGISSLRSSSLSPDEQRVLDAKGRDIIRRCLDKAQGGGSRVNPDNPFKDNGRDLMAEAEKALRNPSAQRFFLSILAQRSRLENKKSRSMRRQAAQGNTTSRLDPLAFNCMVRLSCAMLDSCMEFKEYEIAYRLLTMTAGFVMMVETDDDFEEEDPSKLIVTMTSRVGLHPIFADIGVWEAVMTLHLLERKSAKLSDTRFDEVSGDEDDDDEIEYEAAVATLYEMVGYGIPGEELSRFATRASEENGWFCDDRGRQLLLLARRISIRRDQADSGATGDACDIDMARKAPDTDDAPESCFEGIGAGKDEDYRWTEIEWCHPAAPPSRPSKRDKDPKLSPSSSSLDHYMKRSPVTALASFGSSIVVSGGLDGGVFMAHSIHAGTDEFGFAPAIRGVHLDWGSASRAGAGSSSDGEYGVGAVCCLAAVSGGGQIHSGAEKIKDTVGGIEDVDLANLLEGSRVVAGTTAGDLRVWSVKEIYSSIMMSATAEGSDGGHAASRLKFSLRGRALSGHRGGVTCIDVPSQVYRPDSLITGGADGLIKLWSLRAPTGVRRVTDDNEGSSGPQRGRGGDALTTLEGHNGRILCVQTAWHGDHLLSGSSDRTLCVWDLAAGGGGKCIHKLSGHLGWITHTKYWGPNTIVSASTDRSVALWDARVKSTPLFMLRHHDSPISDLFVGGRTEPYMVSASAGGIDTWDFRTLSDSKGDSGLNTPGKGPSSANKQMRSCTIVREPSVTIRPDGLDANSRQKLSLGSVLLARGVKDPLNTFMSIGSDAVLRTWETSTGQLLEDVPTGHCDAVSSFASFSHLPNSGKSQSEPEGDRSSSTTRGTITSSWDGTIRMRKLVAPSQGNNTCDDLSASDDQRSIIDD
mmetsp:Transcript_36256/g.87372  ORF Transcript_36256/g.87372 Transcript_36256/m.87372 type:complete len:2535 (+) Transcript_36256:254-7858(+)